MRTQLAALVMGLLIASVVTPFFGWPPSFSVPMMVCVGCFWAGHEVGQRRPAPRPLHCEKALGQTVAGVYSGIRS